MSLLVSFSVSACGGGGGGRASDRIIDFFLRFKKIFLHKKDSPAFSFVLAHGC